MSSRTAETVPYLVARTTVGRFVVIDCFEVHPAFLQKIAKFSCTWCRLVSEKPSISLSYMFQLTQSCEPINRFRLHLHSKAEPGGGGPLTNDFAGTNTGPSIAFRPRLNNSLFVWVNFDRDHPLFLTSSSQS